MMNYANAGAGKDVVEYAGPSSDLVAGTLSAGRLEDVLVKESDSFTAFFRVDRRFESVEEIVFLKGRRSELGQVALFQIGVQI